MQNAAKPLAMAVVRGERRGAAIRAVLGRANCADDDAFAKRSEMGGRDHRLREKYAGDHRREYARA